MRYPDDYDLEDDLRYRQEREINLKIIWKCPNCNYTYEDVPDCNEGLDCPDCQTETTKVGESYDA